MRAAPSAPHTPEDSCGPWQLLAATTEPAEFPGGQAPRATPLPLRPQHARDRGSSPPQRPAEHRLLLPFTHSFIHQGAALRGPASARQPRVHLPAGPPVQPPSYGTMVHLHSQLPSTPSHFLSLVRETLHGLVPGSFSHHRCAWGS